jgi:hypothetical protein
VGSQAKAIIYQREISIIDGKKIYKFLKIPSAQVGGENLSSSKLRERRWE